MPTTAKAGLPASSREVVRLGIIGVRDHNKKLYNNYEYIARCLDEFIEVFFDPPSEIEIVTGGSKGVEQLALRWAKNCGYPTQTIPPNIAELGHMEAFKVRNHKIIASTDRTILFWDGFTQSIAHAVEAAVHLSRISTVYPIQ